MPLRSKFSFTPLAVLFYIRTNRRRRQ